MAARRTSSCFVSSSSLRGGLALVGQSRCEGCVIGCFECVMGAVVFLGDGVVLSGSDSGSWGDVCSPPSGVASSLKVGNSCSKMVGAAEVGGGIGRKLYFSQTSAIASLRVFFWGVASLLWFGTELGTVLLRFLRGVSVMDSVACVDCTVADMLVVRATLRNRGLQLEVE